MHRQAGPSESEHQYQLMDCRQLLLNRAHKAGQYIGQQDTGNAINAAGTLHHNIMQQLIGQWPGLCILNHGQQSPWLICSMIRLRFILVKLGRSERGITNGRMIRVCGETSGRL